MQLSPIISKYMRYIWGKFCQKHNFPQIAKAISLIYNPPLLLKLGGTTANFSDDGRQFYSKPISGRNEKEGENAPLFCYNYSSY